MRERVELCVRLGEHARLFGRELASCGVADDERAHYDREWYVRDRL